MHNLTYLSDQPGEEGASNPCIDGDMDTKRGGVTCYRRHS